MERGRAGGHPGHAALAPVAARALAVVHTATDVVRLMLAAAARSGSRWAVHAYSSADNAASNATCRSADFRLLGHREHEFPRGRRFRANDWRCDLDAERA